MMEKRRMPTGTRCLVTALALCCCGAAQAAGPVVISQVFGGGANGTTPPWRNDYVELFNRSSAPVTLNGWSVQYASSTGTGNFAGNAIAPLTGVIQPGQYYLVRLGPTTGTAGPLLPTPDATGTQDTSAT